MSKAPKVITKAWLRRRRACADQVEIFAQEWPDGAEVTEANVWRAAELGLDLDWLARRLIKTASAQETYNEATGPVLEAYGEAQETYASGLDALAALRRARSLVRKVYLEAIAQAFIAGLRADGALS